MLNKIVMMGRLFLLTPLREGRRFASPYTVWMDKFLLTPLREGRQGTRTINPIID